MNGNLSEDQSLISLIDFNLILKFYNPENPDSDK